MMARTPQHSYGRAAIIGVLIALALIICAAAYVLVAGQLAATPVGDGPGASEFEARQAKRLTATLATLIISGLLIVLFVVACYLVIRVGRMVREPIAGEPTEYVDAWRAYRVSDEQIEAATQEWPEEERDGEQDADPPPWESDPDES
jgi:hypothetical protein